MRLPSLTALKSFHAAAEHLSFKKAAEQLSVTPAALSFQIRQLEETLGCELFIRQNRQVRLSTEGMLIQADIRSGFEHFERALRRLQQRQQRHSLNISCGPAFTANWLSPRLHRFLMLQPTLDTRISATLALVDLRDEDIDVAIRFSSADQPGYSVFKVADDYLAPMCCPALLQGDKPLRAPADLAGHTLIHSESGNTSHRLDNWQSWLAKAGAREVDTEATGLHFDVANHALNAAMAGAGIVLGREVLAQRDLEAGRLVKPFDLRIKTHFAFYAVVLEERVEEPAIAAFLAWVKDEADFKES